MARNSAAVDGPRHGHRLVRKAPVVGVHAQRRPGLAVVGSLELPVSELVRVVVAARPQGVVAGHKSSVQKVHRHPRRGLVGRVVDHRLRVRVLHEMGGGCRKRCPNCCRCSTCSPPRRLCCADSGTRADRPQCRYGGASRSGQTVTGNATLSRTSLAAAQQGSAPTRPRCRPRLLPVRGSEATAPAKSSTHCSSRAPFVRPAGA